MEMWILLHSFTYERHYQPGYTICMMRVNIAGRDFIYTVFECEPSNINEIYISYTTA